MKNKLFKKNKKNQTWNRQEAGRTERTLESISRVLYRGDEIVANIWIGHPNGFFSLFFLWFTTCSCHKHLYISCNYAIHEQNGILKCFDFWQQKLGILNIISLKLLYSLGCAIFTEFTEWLKENSGHVDRIPKFNWPPTESILLKLLMNNWNKWHKM